MVQGIWWSLTATGLFCRLPRRGFFCRWPQRVSARAAGALTFWPQKVSKDSSLDTLPPRKCINLHTATYPRRLRWGTKGWCCLHTFFSCRSTLLSSQGRDYYLQAYYLHGGIFSIAVQSCGLLCLFPPPPDARVRRAPLQRGTRGRAACMRTFFRSCPLFVLSGRLSSFTGPVCLSTKTRRRC